MEADIKPMFSVSMEAELRTLLQSRIRKSMERIGFRTYRDANENIYDEDDEGVMRVRE